MVTKLKGGEDMRTGILVLATLTWLYQPQAYTAQATNAGAARGFEATDHASWRFAQLRPKVACTGQIVVATWYATGRRTASGEPFNPNGLTAAHRTLLFGSRVTVTNPRNEKSVTVVINDRGPFTRGVTIDLARGAARAIGMTGTQRVCMSVLGG